jgi:hypothetical protein
MSTSVVPWLAGPGFVVFFVVMWLCMSTLLMTFAGWRRLEARYPDTGEPALLTLRGRSGSMGMGVSMNGILRLSACRSGLRIGIWRIFGPFQRPFLVPWDHITATPKTMFFMRRVRLSFGAPEVGQLTIDDRSWGALLAQPHDGGRQLAATMPQPTPRRRAELSLLAQWLAMTAFAGTFFAVVSRLGGAPGLPLAMSYGFPGTVFGVATFVRYLRRPKY